MSISSENRSAAYCSYKALAYNGVGPNSPALDIVRALFRMGLIVISPARHRRVVLCLRHERFRAFVSRQPQLPFKYLRRNYLAASLDRDQRARILTFHFDYTASHFKRAAMLAIARDGVMLWKHLGCNGTHYVRLSVPNPVDNEGELALEYVFEGQVIYLLSFTFAPRSLFGLPGEATALISRVQANGVDVTLLRQVAKEIGDIAPRHILIFAMQGLLLALEQDLALAVSVAAHTVSRLHSQSISAASYDGLFESLGAVQKHGSFYHLPLPFQEHEPAQATSSHRRRARQRRARRQRISEEVRLAATALIMPPRTTEKSGRAASIRDTVADEVVFSQAE